MSIAITPADGPEDMDIIREMFMEYQKMIDVDLCFQDFETELAEMPGLYAPPKGGLFLAREGDDIAAVIGVRPIEDGKAEMKRLYVRNAWRGRGLGRRLANTVINTAAKAGYRTICLDTLDFMDEARAPKNPSKKVRQRAFSRD